MVIEVRPDISEQAFAAELDSPAESYIATEAH